MFLEIRHGTLYVDGEFVGNIDDSISRSIWVEGITREEVTDQEKFPSAFFWAWTGARLAGVPSPTKCGMKHCHVFVQRQYQRSLLLLVGVVWRIDGHSGGSSLPSPLWYL